MTLSDQPISARKIISNSLKLYFKNLGSLFKIALLWAFPVFMLVTLISNPYGQEVAFWRGFLSSVLGGILSSLGWGVTAYFVANILLGKKITLRQCSQAAWQWFFPLLRTGASYYLLLFASGMLLGAIALTNYGLLTILGVLLAAILCFLLAIWFAFCIPVCIIEKKSPLESFKRSKFLVNKNIWHVSKVFILGLLLFFGMVVILLIPLTIMTLLEVEFLSQPIISASISNLLLTIVFPFWPIVYTLLYLDLRTRKEAFDSEVLTKDLSRYGFVS